MLRLLGFLPLTFFVGIAVHHYRAGRWGDALWMCHLSNLLLAAGLFLLNPFFVFMALPWLCFGIPLWLAEVVRIKKIVPFSIVTHFGGVALGFYAGMKLGPSPGTWWASWLFALAAQGACRLLTRPEWNVNVTHRVYDAWKPYFKRFRSFWLFCLLTAALILWGMDQAFSALFARS